MLNEERLELIKYRLEKAYSDIISAKALFQIGQYLAANNRAYYSIFHSMRAVCAVEKKDFKHHSGVISYFQQHYVKTGIFQKRHSEIIMNASFNRGMSDYSDFYIASKEESENQVIEAEEFYNAVKEYFEKTIEQPISEK